MAAPNPAGAASPGGAQAKMPRTTPPAPPPPPAPPARSPLLSSWNPAPPAPPPPAPPFQRKTPLKIPPILLEGDDIPLPSAPTLEPAQVGKFALAPEPAQPAGTPPPPGASAPLAPSVEPRRSAEERALPADYGTRRLLLTARDSRWLYAHWDLSAEQLSSSNAASASGHLVLRVHKHDLGTAPAQSIELHSDSTHWFVPVDQAGARYIGELGYYADGGDWRRVAVSDATLTPPESVSEETATRFSTIPQDVPLPQLLALVKTAVREQPSLAEALQRLKAGGHSPLPRASIAASTAEWTPAQEQALARVISLDPSRRVWMGSLEITEVIRRQLAQEISSGTLAARPSPGVAGARDLGLESLQPSSPRGGATAPPPRGFWFNINAELVVYGATESDAQVEIGGRRVKLRPDGTFSFRFILPDGNYELPVTAKSADGSKTRQARLQFQRGTEYRGTVGAHPQNPSLREPRPENAA